MLPRLYLEVYDERTERNLGHIHSSKNETGNDRRLHFQIRIIPLQKMIQFKQSASNALLDWFSFYNLIDRYMYLYFDSFLDFRYEKFPW